MKKESLFTLIFLAFGLMSCQQGRNNKVQYKEYTSPDNTYVVSVPEKVPQTQYCIGNYMSFADKDEGIIISIQFTSSNYLSDEVTKISNEKYSYSQIETSDTSALYQFSQGMITAYKYFLIKRCPDANYLISVSLLNGSKMGVKEMGSKIYASLKPCRAKETETKEQKTMLKADMVYSTSYYSIKYPKEWIVVENIDEETDAYIASETEGIGIIIMRFETDTPLAEGNTSGNESIRQAGARILEEKLITFKGVKCYRAIQEIPSRASGYDRLISYSFKKGDMFYNIRIGKILTKEQESLAEEIFDSFRFK